MFIKKIVLIAAAVAVSMTHVAAVEEATHIKIHVGYDKHHKAVADVNVTESDSSSGSFDLDDSHDGSDEDNHDGSHEVDSEALSEEEDGSHDDDSHDGSDEDEGSHEVDSEALSEEEDGSHDDDSHDDDSGSADNDDVAGDAADSLCTGKDESPISVEGVEGIFCVTGQACADVEGACPGPQEGLPKGSYCGKVGKGVLGCKPNTTEAKHHKKHNVVKLHAKPVVKKVQHKKPVVKKAEHKKPVAKKVAHKKEHKH